MTITLKPFIEKNYQYRSRFNQKLGRLLNSLQTNAAAGNSEKKFADGSTRTSDFEIIYVLVQCTPDLSLTDCTNCLGDAINKILTYCAGKQGAFILNPSCTIRFETSLFYYPDDNVSNSTIVRPPRPPPKTNDTGTDREKDGGKLKVAATNDFSDANKLGRGGFGAVYKGLLSNGVQVAVKRLANNSGQGEIEFKNEVLLLAGLQYRNLVKLLGFCLERDERLLIYEFAPNRSLDHFLFGTECIFIFLHLVKLLIYYIHQ
ncbi:hypothetical protein RND81_11G172500 [Saponaria officinalis]|uniref:Uncharacterized protein n=1 Tax=Saponaria officinalis TaxID=3572 RepID=A0AAW1HN61_SAPOF